MNQLSKECSHVLVKNGFANPKKGRIQKFKCKICGKQFNKLSGTPFHRMNYTHPLVLFALHLKIELGLTLRNVSRLLEKFGVHIPESTISTWTHKFGEIFEELGKKFPVNFSDIWHIDELFVKIDKEMHYLWIIMDSKRNILTTHLSKKRDTENAVIALKKAKEKAGFIPKIVVSDGLGVYPRAIKRAFGWKAGVKHVISHFRGEVIHHLGKLFVLSNNVLERLNGTIRSFTNNLRGLKSIDAGSKIMKLFSFFYNFIRPHSFFGGLPPSLAEARRRLEWREIPLLLGCGNTEK
jgi:transposase-like protein